MLTEVLKEITGLRITLQAYLSVTTQSNTINPMKVSVLIYQLLKLLKKTVKDMKLSKMYQFLQV